MSPGPGWYAYEGDVRWWDGERWTEHRRPDITRLVMLGYLLAILFPPAGVLVGIGEAGRSGHGHLIFALSLLVLAGWVAAIAALTSV